MQIELVNEAKIFDDKKQAITELAFCHYPVAVIIEGELRVFDSFDSAREFVESFINN